MFTVLQESKELNGIRTEIILQTFADRILLLITQKGKVGNLIQVSIPSTTPLLPRPSPDPSNPGVLPLPPPPAAIQLTPLLGSAPSEHIQSLHSIYAAQAATIVWTYEDQLPIKYDRRSVVVGFALQSSRGGDVVELDDRKPEREDFQAVMNMLQEMLISASA